MLKSLRHVVTQNLIYYQLLSLNPCIPQELQQTDH